MRRYHMLSLDETSISQTASERLTDTPAIVCTAKMICMSLLLREPQPPGSIMELEIWYRTGEPAETVQPTGAPSAPKGGTLRSWRSQS